MNYYTDDADDVISCTFGSPFQIVKSADQTAVATSIVSRRQPCRIDLDASEKKADRSGRGTVCKSGVAHFDACWTATAIRIFTG